MYSSDPYAAHAFELLVVGVGEMARRARRPGAATL